MATRKKALVSRAQLQRDVKSLLHANRLQAEKLAVRQAQLEEGNRTIESLKRDLEGMVRTHKEQVEQIKQRDEKIKTLQTYAQTLLGNIDATREALRKEMKRPEQDDMEMQEAVRLMNARLTWYVSRLEKIDPLLARLEKEFEEVQDKLDKAFERVDDRLKALECELTDRVNTLEYKLDNLRVIS